MKVPLRHTEGLRAIGAAALFLAAFASVFFYITKTYRAFLSSDAAVSNILAGEIQRSGNFFPRDFWYVNGDLWILFKHVLVLPWLTFGQNNYAAHAFAVFCATLIFLGCAFGLLRSLRCSYAQTFMGLLVLCLGYSDHYLDMIYGEAAYSWTATFLMGFLWLTVVMQQRGTDFTHTKWYGLLLVALIYLISVANPTRFLVFTLAPLSLAAVLAYSARLRRLRPTSLVAGWAAVPLVALVLAVTSHTLILGTVSNIEGASAATFIALEKLPAALAHLGAGILRVLGVNWREGVRLGSIDGLVMMSRLFVYPVLLVAPALVIRRHWGSLQFGERLLGLTAYIGLSGIAFLVASTSLQGSGPVSAIYTTRYVIPYVLLILLAAVSFWQKYTLIERAWVLAAFALIVIGSWKYISPQEFREQEFLPNAANVGYKFEPGWHSRVKKTERVISGLVSAGLKYGYAPYWHSHPYTVLSGGKLEIRPVHLNGGDIRPWLHLSSSRWYKSGYAESNVFLLIPPSETKEVLAHLNSGCSERPTRMLKIEDYTVLVYDKNPLTAVATRNLEGRGTLCLSKDSLRQIGTYDASLDVIRAAASEGAGLIHYGPYQTLERGEYLVSFHLESSRAVSPATSNLGFVEVTGRTGKVTFGKAQLVDGRSILKIPVRIDASAIEQVEFRVYTAGHSDVLLRKIEVQSTSASAER